MAEDEKKPTVAIVVGVDDLIKRSSLGTPGALLLRRVADRAAVAQILLMAGEPRAAEIALADLDPELQHEIRTKTKPRHVDAEPCLDDDDPESMLALEAELGRLESNLVSTEKAQQWWRFARQAWGRLQQVRKGTRVRCVYGCRSGCPMCDFGFMDRDSALVYLESDMEFAQK